MSTKTTSADERGGDVDAPAPEAPEPDADERTLAGTGFSAPRILTGSVVGLLALAVLYTLYFARDLLVPVTAALFLDFLLTPLVRKLSRRLHVSRSFAAILVFLGVLGAVGLTTYQLAGPTLEWIESAPERVREAETKLRSLSESVEEVREAVDQAAAAGNGGEEADRETVQVESESTADRLFSRAGESFVGLVAALFLLLFLLARGDLLLRRVLGTLSRWGHRRRMVEIIRRIERDLFRYLITKSLINAGLGVAVGTAMWLWGMPNPALWGVAAGLLNFVPYVGGVVGVTFLAVVGLVSFEGVGRGLLPALTYLALNATEAYAVTPAIMGRRFAMNPIAVFLSVLFWGWIWGIAGALMAVPMLTALGIITGRIERLRPAARIIRG